MSGMDGGMGGSMAMDGGMGGSMAMDGGMGGMGMGEMTFHATLDPNKEVPPPKLDSGARPSGSASFTVNGSTITYRVTASGLSSQYTGAHIHTGAEGVAGPVIAPLTLNQTSTGEVSGEGTIDASAIKAKKPDGSTMSIDDVVSAMKSGNTYVNVHTQNNKPGEARGQITQ
jgi:hypothetical protein